MQDEYEVKTNYPEHHELIISKPTHLKITLIAKFSKKIPFISFSARENKNNREERYFDMMRSQAHGIADKNGLSMHDLIGSCIGTNHIEIIIKDGSAIKMQESMISNNIRKTETEIVINDISPEKIIKIMTQVDQQKYLGNGAELEDLYVQINPENHPLENTIKDAYRDAGFNLLQYDPTMTNIRFFLSEAYSVYRLGVFNYAQRVVRDSIAKKSLGLSNSREAIDKNMDDLENNAPHSRYLPWKNS